MEHEEMLQDILELTRKVTKKLDEAREEHDEAKWSKWYGLYTDLWTAHDNFKNYK